MELRMNISVGYSITKMERAKNDIFGEHYRASMDMPMEASVVSVPADPGFSKSRSWSF